MANRVFGNRMLPLIGVVLALGFLATNVLSYMVSAGAIRTAIIEHELPLTGNNVYSEVEKDLVRPILVSSLMANDTFVQDWLKGGELDLGAITRYLKKIQAEYNTFTAFLISRDTQAYYHFSAPPFHVKRDDPADAWFFHMIDSDRPFEVNVDYNKAQDNALTVFINYRVIDHDGRMIGLTGVGLDFSNVRNIVSRYRAQFDRNIYFVDMTGKIVVATDSDTPVGANIKTLEGLSGIADRVLGEDRGDYSFTRHNSTILLSQRNIPDLGWRVLVEQDEAVALRPLRIGFLTNIGIGLALVALVLGLFGVTLYRHGERMRQLLFVDAVTGLGSRQRLDIDVGRGLERLASGALSLIVVDLDRFGAINERYGRSAGDDVLKSFATLIGQVAGSATSICRYDGAVFGLLWKGDEGSALAFAQRLVKAIGLQMVVVPDDGNRLTASVGVAELRAGEAAADLFERAEAAVRHVKANGGNGCLSG